MRKLWIVVGALLVVFGATVVTAALSLHRLIEGNSDRIIAEAQTALGRPVAVARISVSLWGGIAVRLDDVRIADDPRVSRDDFVRVATLRAHAKLWPLLHQRFELSRVVATQPHITLIRDAGGRWNYATLRPLAARETSGVASGIIRVANLSAAPEPEARPLPIVIRDAAIADGTLVVVDRSQTAASTTRVTHLDARLGYTSAATPVSLRLAAAVAADSRNIDVHGSIGPWDERTGLPLRLDGTLGPVAPFNARIDALHVVATLIAEEVQVSELSGRTLGGPFTLSGAYPLRANATLALRGTVRELDLAEAFKVASGDATARIGGRAHIIMDVSGTGATREAIAASVAGRLVVDIHDGVLTQLNIANAVLGKASRLPVVGSVVSEKIEPKYAQLFADPDTHFETLHGTFTIGGQRAQTDDLAIMTTDYGVLGRGWIGFDNRIDMAGKLRMSKRFSNDVVADVHAAKYLLDDDGQLALPFHLRGKLGDAKPNLDNDDIMALVQRGAVRGGAKDLLDKFFGTKPQATPGARSNLIEEALRHLFGR